MAAIALAIEVIPTLIPAITPDGQTWSVVAPDA